MCPAHGGYVRELAGQLGCIGTVAVPRVAGLAALLVEADQGGEFGLARRQPIERDEDTDPGPPWPGDSAAVAGSSQPVHPDVWGASPCAPGLETAVEVPLFDVPVGAHREADRS